MSVLFEEVPPWAPLVLSLILGVPLAIVVTSMYQQQKADSNCHIAAVEWESLNSNGAAFKAIDKTYFKKQYKSFRSACPNGHALVDEALIPTEVKAAYMQEKK